MATATITRALRPVRRFVRLLCPECECVQGAHIDYTLDGVEVRDWECIYCGCWITEDGWDEVTETD